MIRVAYYSADGTPRDRNRNALSTCQCGALKLRRVQRCKACAVRAQIGVPKTENPKEGATRYRARQMVSPGPCTYEGGCDKDGSHVHHIDGNPYNNDRSNLTRLCPRHHMAVDGRLDAARARAAHVGRQFGGRPPRKVCA